MDTNHSDTFTAQAWPEQDGGEEQTPGTISLRRSWVSGHDAQKADIDLVEKGNQIARWRAYASLEPSERTSLSEPSIQVGAVISTEGFTPRLHLITYGTGETQVRELMVEFVHSSPDGHERLLCSQKTGDPIGVDAYKWLCGSRRSFYSGKSGQNVEWMVPVELGADDEPTRIVRYLIPSAAASALLGEIRTTLGK